jgi:hypothetical protein
LERRDVAPDVLLLINVAATFFMVGLIWFVQIVHYPGLAFVGRDQFGYYHAAHVKRTTAVIAIPTLVEAATSALLVWKPPTPSAAPACWAGFALVVFIWIVTAALLMPRHNLLAIGFDASAHYSLVAANWIRTVAWTVRGTLMAWTLTQECLSGTSI